MSLNRQNAGKPGHEAFECDLGLLDLIASWHLRSSAAVLVLLPLAIGSIALSLFAQQLLANWVAAGLLVMLWIVTAGMLHQLRQRFAELRKNLVKQMDGIARNHAKAEKFYGLSIIDPLTGLYNRRFGEIRLQEEVAQAGESTEPLLLLAIDFDRFKEINDTYGHAAGDIALKAFSRRLQRAIRACDVPVRVGGDEFLVILPGCPTDNVSLVFSRMGEITINVDGNVVPVSFSWGMSQYQPADTPETMLKRADERLYAEKIKRKAAAPVEEPVVMEPVGVAQTAASSLSSSSEFHAASERVRRSGRLAKQTAVLLSGDDLGGKVFLEPTVTIELSRHGGVIASRHKLAAEQPIIVRCVATAKETEARIVRVLGSHLDHHIYGIAFATATVNIWDDEFPSVESEKEASVTLFKCRGCRGRATLDELAATENNADVIAGHFCRRCGTATVWERIHHTAAGTVAELPQEIPEQVPVG